MRPVPCLMLVLVSAGLVSAPLWLAGCAEPAEEPVAPPAPQGPAPPAPAPAALSVADIRRLLAQPIAVDFRKTLALAALQEIERKVPGLKIVIDQDIRESQRLFAPRVLDFSARRMPLADALVLVLGPELSWQVLPGCIRIVEFWSGQEPLAAARYPVRRLLTYIRGGHPDGGAAGQELIDIVQRNVCSWLYCRAAAWADEGGPATIDLSGNDLLVRQTYEGHRQIALLLAAISEGMGVEPETPPPDTSAERRATDEVRRLLAQPISVDFERANLEDALQNIRELVPGLDIVLDTRAAASNRESELPIEYLDVRNVPAGEVLHLIADHCIGAAEDLRVTARPGYVLITTETVSSEYMTSVVYPIWGMFPVSRRGLQPWEGGWQELQDCLERYVNNRNDCDVAAWRDEGGPAGIEYFGGVLIITQAEAGQRRAAEFLRQIGTAVAVARQLSNGPRRAVAPVTVPAADVAATAAALQVRMDVDFQDASPAAAIRQVTERDPRLNLVLDFRSGYPTEPITLKRENATRQEMLEAVCGERLACQVRPGCVAMVGRSAVRTPPLEVAIYPIRDFIGAGFVNEAAARSLIDNIRRRTLSGFDPRVAAWMNEGGRAEIEYLWGCLIVSQSHYGQQRVNALVQEYRFKNPYGTRPRSR